LALFDNLGGYQAKLKGRVRCFSMQVVINKCFLLNPEKEFGTNPFGRFQKRTKNAHLKSKKSCHRAKGKATLITS